MTVLGGGRFLMSEVPLHRRSVAVRHHLALPCLCGVWCLVFGVWEFGFRVWGLGFGVEGAAGGGVPAPNCASSSFSVLLSSVELSDTQVYEP